MKTRILFPNQLFNIKHKESRVIVVLDPVFFSGPDGTFKIHKAKLAYLLAASLEYVTENKADICYPEDVAELYRSLKEVPVVAYPPMDRFVEHKLRSFKQIVFDTHPVSSSIRIHILEL